MHGLTLENTIIPHHESQKVVAISMRGESTSVLVFFGFEGGNRKPARASLVEHTRVVKVLHFLNNFVCQNIAVLSLNYDLYLLTVVAKTIPTN